MFTPSSLNKMSASPQAPAYGSYEGTGYALDEGSADTNIIRSESEYVNIEVVPLDEVVRTEDTTRHPVSMKKSGAAISENPSLGAERSTAPGFGYSISDADGDVNLQHPIPNPERRRDTLAQLGKRPSRG